MKTKKDTIFSKKMISRKQVANLLLNFAKDFESIADSDSTEKSKMEFIFDAVNGAEKKGLRILSAEYVETTQSQLFSSKAFVCVLRGEMSAKDFSNFPLPVEWAIDNLTKQNYSDKFSVDEKIASWSNMFSIGFHDTCVLKKNLFVPKNIKNLENMIQGSIVRFQYYNLVITESPDGNGFFYYHQ